MDCAFSKGSITTLKNSSQNTLNYFFYPLPYSELFSQHKDSDLRMQFPFFTPRGVCTSLLSLSRPGNSPGPDHRVAMLDYF